MSEATAEASHDIPTAEAVNTAVATAAGQAEVRVCAECHTLYPVDPGVNNGTDNTECSRQYSTDSVCHWYFEMIVMITYPGSWPLT